MGGGRSGYHWGINEERSSKQDIKNQQMMIGELKMKLKMLTVMVVLALAMAAFGGTVALACQGHSGLQYYINTSSIGARIGKCDCAPVDNYLYASTKAQYYDPSDNAYHWTNWKERYGEDVNSVTSTTDHSNLYCGYCHYRWECYTGSSGRHMAEYLNQN